MTAEHPPRTCRRCGDPAVARLFAVDDTDEGLRCAACLRDDV
jgi:hypothetical protein